MQMRFDFESLKDHHLRNENDRLIIENAKKDKVIEELRKIIKYHNRISRLKSSDKKGH
jgi:hypothetical protein